MVFDTVFSRSQFPHQAWDIAFFENAGGTFVPNTVISRLTDYMTESQVQPGANFPKSKLAESRMSLGHSLVAQMLAVPDNEIVISASTSMNVYVLAKALRHHWKRGDEIIISQLNHEANSGPWRCLEEFGIKIIEWPIDSELGEMSVSELENLLSDKTRLVAFPHVSNITGTINDIELITKKVHSVGGMVCVDGVAYAPHRMIDVKKWDVDFYLFSFYKVFGPHLGCLYGKEKHLTEAKGQYHYFVDEKNTSLKLNPAGPDHASISALAGIADYFEILSNHHFNSPKNTLFENVKSVYELTETHEESLSKKFLDFLLTKSNIRVLGKHTWSKKSRCATFSITSNKKKSAEISKLVGEDKVGIGSGHFYAKRVVQELGVSDPDDGVVRCSMAHYNTKEEVDLLIKSLDKIL